MFSRTAVPHRVANKLKMIPFRRKSLDASKAFWAAAHPVRSGGSVAGAMVTADKLATTADHDEMRQACQTSYQLVKADVEPKDRIFKLSAADQMYQLAGFNFTYFFKGHTIQPELLKRALQGVLGEAPHLAGRGKLQGYGMRFIDAAVECTNEGVELITGTVPNITLKDVAPHTWSHLTCGTTLGNSPMAFYDQPLDPSAARAGKQRPLKIRLTDLADGQVLSTSGWHVMADAGRAIRLAARLSDYYRALASGQPAVGMPLQAGTLLFDSPENITAALADDLGKGWEPKPVSWEPNIKMSLKQRLSTPLELYRSVTNLHDVHTVYLPEEVVAKIKAAAAGACGGYRISTADAVQAMLFTMMADIRGKPLVPKGRQMFTSTADMLQGLNLKDPRLARQYLGNALEIVFLEGGDNDWDPTKYATQEERFLAAVAFNARIIREGISTYRADISSTLNSIAGFHNMVREWNVKVATNYVMRGALQKIASSSYLTKFPLHEVDFGGGGPCYKKTDILPWSDWWYSAMSVPGIDGGKGIICRLVLGHGTAEKLKSHPLWTTLAAGAQLAIAGERREPFSTANKADRM